MGVLRYAGYTFEEVENSCVIITHPSGLVEKKHKLAAENLLKQLKKTFGDVKEENLVLEVGSEKFLKIQAVASMLNAFCPRHFFRVENCYLDFGANRAWTTVIQTSKQTGSIQFQMFTEKQQKDLLNMSYTDFTKEMSKIIQKINKQQ